jgi:hypothetical protein
MVIRRVDPVSFAKIGGVLYFLMGLLFGVLFALFSFGGLGGTDMLPFGAMFGVGAIIILPIIYGVLGFIVTLIGAACFNLAAKFTGGLIVDAE